MLVAAEDAVSLGDPLRLFDRRQDLHLLEGQRAGVADQINLGLGDLGADLAVLTIFLTLFPAGPQEFDEAFVAKAARELDLPADRRDPFFDAVTRAIDEPMALK